MNFTTQAAGPVNGEALLPVETDMHWGPLQAADLRRQINELWEQIENAQFHNIEDNLEDSFGIFSNLELGEPAPAAGPSTSRTDMVASGAVAAQANSPAIDREFTIIGRTMTYLARNRSDAEIPPDREWTTPKTYHCNQCSKIFFHRLALYRHHRFHIKKLLRCKYCPRTLYNLSNVRRHYEYFHDSVTRVHFIDCS